jgi:hypothetical protein
LSAPRNVSKGGSPPPVATAGASSGDRTHLARLCRGFLLAREEDPRRAEAFLVSFLTELQRGLPGAFSPPAGPLPTLR